jgi:ABC-type phosphate transport system permease subunit
VDAEELESLPSIVTGLMSYASFVFCVGEIGAEGRSGDDGERQWARRTAQGLAGRMVATRCREEEAHTSRYRLAWRQNLWY